MDMLPVDFAQAEQLTLGPDHYTVLATGEQTGGEIFAVEVRMAPGGGPPVMHRHAPAEIYHVTAGEFAFYVGEPDGTVRRFVAGAGDVVPLRGGTPHTIRNEGDVDARAFVVHSPAAVMERFSRAAAELAASTPGEPPVMEDILELAARHGVKLLGPVPVAT
jgi:mannose-6-phosphate isomerase-like protein (cupin superfamily)